VIIVGFKLKHYQQHIYLTMINSLLMQHRLGKEMYSLTQFINTMQITDHSFKNTKNILMLHLTEFYILKMDSQLICRTICLTSCKFMLSFYLKDQSLMNFQMKQVKICGLLLFLIWLCFFISVIYKI